MANNQQLKQASVDRAEKLKQEQKSRDYTVRILEAQRLAALLRASERVK